MNQVLVLGAGQLARMMALAGAPLNIDVIAYDVVSTNVVHPLTQQCQSLSLIEAIAAVDVITAEFEHIPTDILSLCAASGKFKPHPEAIKAGGDRRIEKTLLDLAKVANAPHHIINTRTDLDAAITTLGLPMVLKTALGGYDGKGQWRLKTRDQIESVWAEMAHCIAVTNNQAIVAEKFIGFDREVSLIGVRNANGDVKTYALSENVHTDGVLSLSTAIVGDTILQQQAQQMFTAVAEQLNYIGVLALEFFEVNGALLVNEIAPRVHNSGHWTQQGAQTCQFENHLRAVCDLPLGGTALIRPSAMINILGQDSVPRAVLALESCHVHWYGKEKRAGRKMGHINVCATTPEQLQYQLMLLGQILSQQYFPTLPR
ncbi:phosphoribosylaminoimidazole carboxylase [Photobacterium iliopiscarium]|jgi:5-(carboxyamino)imidazole ribonucleotide synthase|uniref:N5-carboxyaminoimidazole ribonucleotide synthase n=1 Tax=Photobacterium iliopiscarium TaxID=56192 RepID=A0A0D8PTQ1_9GAMM|nr:5-(carboxyamino)imidazole ribonucleotide synthase [Photobacterium iliopiscarium]KJG21973.1 phosphoribosylaminoimidazole carboxylase [Photobacterium iliopiscarium]MCD9467716.1 5-(carboxyamino)imidazole ribonucleotide synthase [Photobacterium iliopiscarium]MCD9487424.1 5-(carboxyamino)imidazole ribonucleotide synthase [Photobacterium iliopiscarium]MCF2244140.1 5-(carboxyamino)imidazole ribonucleotide synthase [Photobacterium iliopiscarium]PSV94285.1 5-(carboxyamino)imidazole ribonucleotide sy